jgi:hypothetical protein
MKNIEGEHESQESISDRILDQLVDGELDHQEYSRVLRRLEIAPDGWRRCALAFLEAQAWKRDITPAAVNTGEVYSSSQSTDVVTRRPDGGSVMGPRLNWRTGRVSWLGLVAAVLFAFALGTGVDWRGLRSPGSFDTPFVSNDPAPPALPPNPSARQHLVSSDFWDGRPTLSPEVMSALEELGVNVRQRRGYIPGRTSDGRPALVPVEEMELIPVGHYPY